MKTINVTSKKTMKLPSTFTMKELIRANPDVKSQTLYQRVQSLKRNGVIVERGEVKRVKDKEAGVTKGRAEIVYSTTDANENHNLLRQAKSQGRLHPTPVNSEGIVTETASAMEELAQESQEVLAETVA